jgi:membrane-associated protein
VAGDLVDAVVGLMSSPWLYLVIALLSLADALVPLAPSETVVITAGVFAAAGTPDVALVVTSAAAGAMAGDHLSFLIGRLSSRWTTAQSPATRRGRAVHRARALLAERGGMALVVARYVPGGRTAVTLSMGALRHPYRDFLRWDVAAALSWAAWCTAVGLVGGAAFADRPLLAVGLGMGIALGVAGLAEVVRHVRGRRTPTVTDPDDAELVCARPDA